MLWITLCAGNQNRFAEMGNGFRKQLIKVHGETLIHRQLRQVRDRGQDLAIVTHDPDLMDAAATAFKRIIIPERRRFTCESLLSTARHWPRLERVVVLLGDVYYTDALMDAIASFHSLPVAFFGNVAETWALTFDAQGIVADACAQTIDACEQEKAVGSIRNVYHSVMGLPYEGNAYEPGFQFEMLRTGHANWRQAEDAVWRYWSDETCDFDIPRHLKRVQTLEYGK